MGNVVYNDDEYRAEILDELIEDLERYNTVRK